MVVEAAVEVEVVGSWASMEATSETLLPPADPEVAVEEVALIEAVGQAIGVAAIREAALSMEAKGVGDLTALLSACRPFRVPPMTSRPWM